MDLVYLGEELECVEMRILIDWSYLGGPSEPIQSENVDLILEAPRNHNPMINKANQNDQITKRVNSFES